MRLQKWLKMDWCLTCWEVEYEFTYLVKLAFPACCFLLFKHKGLTASSDCAHDCGLSAWWHSACRSLTVVWLFSCSMFIQFSFLACERLFQMITAIIIKRRRANTTAPMTMPAMAPAASPPVAAYRLRYIQKWKICTTVPDIMLVHLSKQSGYI